jgi:hypothetical protein
MRLAPLLLVAATALALAAPAAAKELTKAELCGPTSCAAVTDKDDLRQIPTGGETLGARPPLSRFYTLSLSAEDDVATHTWRIYYIPDANMLGVRDPYGSMNWHPIYGAAIGMMKRLAARVEPFAAPKITSVAIGDRVVREDPASYLPLLHTSGARTAHNLSPADWVAIDFRSDRPSPWTDGARELMYSPSTNVLERRTDRLVLSDGVAADIEAARPLSSDGGARWLPWLVLGGLLAALVLLAGLGALLRARGGAAPTPEPAA